MATTVCFRIRLSPVGRKFVGRNERSAVTALNSYCRNSACARYGLQLQLVKAYSYSLRPVAGYLTRQWNRCAVVMAATHGVAVDM